MKKNLLLNESCNEFSADHKYNGIDLVKFICAYLVCIIHIQPFNVEALGIESLNYFNFGLQQYLSRIAVPFYFTAAGFLLFRKIDISCLDMDKIKKYCFKIFRLLGIWTFLLFLGAKGHLWYLGALALAVIIISVLIKKGLPLRYIMIISACLFVIGLLGDTYYGFIEPLKEYGIFRLFINGYETFFRTTRNGLFFGTIFVFMGLLFAKKQIVINKGFAIGGLIVSLGAMFLEVFLLKHYSNPKDYNMYICLIPVIFFLFYIASHIELKNRPIYARLRVIGLLVFFSHLFVNYLVVLAIGIINSRTGINLIVFQFIITICLTTLLAVLVERLSKREKYSWLKYLYS